ncbi:MAG: hypothetical protein LH477_16105 [Nocardioides sp.]|nr:hypothetical protein [Nocardioides sp.]
MIWVLVSAVVVLGAAAVLFLLGLRLWRQTKALTFELGVATNRLIEITDRLDDLHAFPESLDGRTDGVGSMEQLSTTLR